MRRRVTLTVLSVTAAVILVSWGAMQAFSGRAAGTLLTSLDRQAPGTAQLVKGYWVARLPSGEYQVYLNQEPHSGRELFWYPHAEETHLNWNFLKDGRPFFLRVQTPKGLFGSPVYGELYTLDGTCFAGPCDKRGLYVVPTKLDHGRLVLAPGIVSQSAGQK
jgi:hypothetical protein